jgi:leader peptidase (prepilin peptidase)/N-methyltransferase
MVKIAFSLTMSLYLLIPFMLLMILLIRADFKARLLPDEYTFSLLWMGLLVNPALGWVSLYAAILGVVGGYLFLWVIYLLFKWRSQKEGMGFGDFKLLAALGAWFGVGSLALILLIATMSTLLVLVVLKYFEKYPHSERIPFGPGLCFAGVVLYVSKCLTLI